MPDYKQGKIYKIINTVNKIVYVGSTCDTLSRRMMNHRSDSNSYNTLFYKAMKNIGQYHFEIVLIRSYPCDSREQLISKQNKTIKKLANSGIELYNYGIELNNSVLMGYHSQETKAKMSESRTKRGSVSFDKINNIWTFYWRSSSGKRRTKSFSVNKYGDDAKKMAIYTQNQLYP
jgi:group I intron endonuclease